MIFFNAIEARGKITKHKESGGREEGQTDFREDFREEEPSQLDQLDDEEGLSGLSGPNAVWNMSLFHCTSLSDASMKFTTQGAVEISNNQSQRILYSVLRVWTLSCRQGKVNGGF